MALDQLHHHRLGLRLATSPFTFEYDSLRMTWNDVISGSLLAFFAALALWPRFDFVGRWSVAFVGIWLQVAPLVFWFISRDLAAYQLGYTDTVWEPFFGEGTEQVRTSDVSKMWPISDAGLGALAYTIEFLMAWMGGT